MHTCGAADVDAAADVDDDVGASAAGGAEVRTSGGDQVRQTISTERRPRVSAFLIGGFFSCCWCCW